MSTAASAQYDVTCPTCAAEPFEPCRRPRSRHITATHVRRIPGWVPAVRTYKRRPAIDRLMDKVRKDESGCWLWTGSTNKRTGYGSITVGDKALLPHRVVYEALIGPIPADLTVDHRCRVRVCMNPDHLRLATDKQQAENRDHGNSTSGVRNVTWIPARKKWRVALKHNGVGYFGGEYRDLDQAASAALALRNRLFTYNDADRIAS